MLLIDELLLQIAVLVEICIKMCYLYKKQCKNSLALRANPPRPPMASCGWGSAPDPAIPPLRIPGFAIDWRYPASSKKRGRREICKNQTVLPCVYNGRQI